MGMISQCECFIPIFKGHHLIDDKDEEAVATNVATSHRRRRNEQWDRREPAEPGDAVRSRLQLPEGFYGQRVRPVKGEDRRYVWRFRLRM